MIMMSSPSSQCFVISYVLLLVLLLLLSCPLIIVSHPLPIYNLSSLLPVPPFVSRSLFHEYLNKSKATILAEIGVQRGKFSQYLLEETPSIVKYYLVDIWATQKFYDDGANYNNSLQEDFYQETIQRVTPFKSKVEVLRMYSTEAAALLTKANTIVETCTIAPILDFLYLDARHDYCGCLEDIVAWWPLLKPGGLMSGHDFIWNHDHEWNLCSNGTRIPGGVRAAVMDWAAEKNLQVLLTTRDKYESWSVRKPIPVPRIPGQPIMYAEPIIQVQRGYLMSTAIMANDPHFDVMVEINPGTGVFMTEFLWRWENCRQYFSVNLDVEENITRGVKRRFEKNLESFKSKVSVIRTNNSDAAFSQVSYNLTHFANARSGSARGMVDVIVIFELRDHCSLLNEIQRWWTLLAPGGLMGGQGFVFFDSSYKPCVDANGVTQPGGVRTAVTTWAQANGLQIVLLPGPEKSWWLRKPIIIY